MIGGENSFAPGQMHIMGAGPATSGPAMPQFNGQNERGAWRRDLKTQLGDNFGAATDAYRNFKADWRSAGSDPATRPNRWEYFQNYLGSNAFAPTPGGVPGQHQTMPMQPQPLPQPGVGNGLGVQGMVAPANQFGLPTYGG